MKQKNNENEKLTEPSMDTKWISLGIVILVILIVGLATLSFTGFFNEFNFTPSIRQSSFLAKIYPDLPPELDILVYMKTTSLSAQNIITVSAKAFPNDNFAKYPNDSWNHIAYTEKMYLLFPHSLNYPLHQYSEGDFAAGIIELTKSNNPREYVGNGQIIYQHEGKYGYHLVTQNFFDKRGINVNQVSVLASEIEPLVGNVTEIEISGADVTVSFQTNNLILTLTWLAVAFGIVQTRAHIISGISWLHVHAIGKRNLVILILVLIVSIILVTLGTLSLDEYKVIKTSEYGLKFVDIEYDFQISKPNTDWYFVQEPQFLRYKILLPLPDVNLAKGTLIHRYTGESVFVGVLDNAPDFSQLREQILQTMPRLSQEREVIYTIDEGTTEFLLNGIYTEDQTIFVQRIIHHNDRVYFIQKTIPFSNDISESVKLEVDSVWNTFDFCSTQFFGCLRPPYTYEFISP